VTLRCLGDLVERMVAAIRRRHLSGQTLLWKVHDVDVFIVRSSFQHMDSIEVRDPS
jgi:hypothetical protein